MIREIRISARRALAPSKEKQVFLLHFARLCVTLAVPKLLTLGNEKKNKFSFCISLVYT